eukprot:12194406-Heterocapsa_arctica.AAC.1
MPIDEFIQESGEGACAADEQRHRVGHRDVRHGEGATEQSARRGRKSAQARFRKDDRGEGGSDAICSEAEGNCDQTLASPRVEAGSLGERCARRWTLLWVLHATRQR